MKPERMRPRWSRYLCATALVSILSASCGRVLVRTYGHGRAPESAGLDIVMPASAPSITQAFRVSGAKSEEGPEMDHDGIDIVAPAGTPVIAAAPGRVARSHLTVIRGHRVVVEHGRDDGGNTIMTEYVHLKKRLVSEGDEVSRGEQIGELGMTGMTAGYPHLHFMVVLVGREKSSGEGRAVEPHLYWAEGEGMVTCYDEAASGRGAFPALTYPVPCR